jgi:hypothetical protein
MDILGNDGERGASCTGDKAEGDDPLSTQEIHIATAEPNGDDEMMDPEPVSSRGKERTVSVRSANCISADFSQLLMGAGDRAAS